MGLKYHSAVLTAWRPAPHKQCILILILPTILPENNLVFDLSQARNQNRQANRYEESVIKTRERI